MRPLFTFAMRYAAAILFVLGLLSAIAMIVVGVDSMAMMGNALDRIGPESSYAGWALGLYARAFAPALNALVWPWLGAAALWRFDIMYLRMIPASAEEAAA
jgi:hypothetical protein